VFDRECGVFESPVVESMGRLIVRTSEFSIFLAQLI